MVERGSLKDKAERLVLSGARIRVRCNAGLSASTWMDCPRVLKVAIVTTIAISSHDPRGTTANTNLRGEPAGGKTILP